MTVKKYLKESIRVGDRDLTVEVGRVANQADGSCVIRYGDTMLLCAAVGAPDAYAGELPVAFATLMPGARATEEELLAFTAQRVDEPPARPKRVTVLERLPMTNVGKIYKPALRCDAAERRVHELLAEQFELHGAQVQVREGGRRGMRVSVTLPLASRDSVPAVEHALAAFLFESEVTLA